MDSFLLGADPDPAGGYPLGIGNWTTANRRIGIVETRLTRTNHVCCSEGFRLAACPVAGQLAKRSLSDQGFKINFGHSRNSVFFTMMPISKLRLNASSVRLALETSAISSTMADFGVQLSWTARLISFPFFNGPVIDLGGFDQRRRKAFRAS